MTDNDVRLLYVFNKLFFSRLEILDPRARSWHPRFIAQLVKIIEAESYLEVGVYRGETIRKVAKNCRKNVGVDIDPLAIKSIHRLRNTTGYLGTLQDYYNSKSVHSNFDIIFIDANHAAEAVFRDFETATKLVSPRGIVMLHDTWPKNEEYTSEKYCGSAYLAVEQIRNKFLDWNCVTLPFHPGLTICQHTSVSPFAQ